MCWSKRSPAKDEDSIPTTTRKPMGELQCTRGSKSCSGKELENECSMHGLCCYNPKESNTSALYMSCVCHPDWNGKFCENKSKPHREIESMATIVTFNAVFGIIIITLFFVACIVLRMKYYRRRKKRQRMLADDDHELDKISRPDASEKESKRSLITQPGYSWRESVRQTSYKASHKFRSTMSRSVPDDLFQVGLKLAIFGGCQPKLSPSDHQSAVGKAEVKAFTTQRCFSAGPDVGDGPALKKDNASASNRPIVFQMPTAAATEAAVTEDTVL